MFSSVVALMMFAADPWVVQNNVWAVTEKRIVAPKTVVITAGWHTHRCPYDGTTWSHGRESYGNQAAHTCPTCGRVIYGNIVANPVIRQPARLPQDCPSGNCPYVRVR